MRSITNYYFNYEILTITITITITLFQIYYYDYLPSTSYYN